VTGELPAGFDAWLTTDTTDQGDPPDDTEPPPDGLSLEDLHILAGHYDVRREPIDSGTTLRAWFVYVGRAGCTQVRAAAVGGGKPFASKRTAEEAVAARVVELFEEHGADACYGSRTAERAAT
jgi:hypothetical protein